LTTKKPEVTVTGVTNPLTVSVNSSHGNPTSVAIITYEGNSLSIGDAITVTMGYPGNTELLFTGYVKRIEQSYPDGVYTATAHDVLIKAIDYFIAASNPENPLTYYQIDAEDLIEDVLSQAGITNYVGDTSNFIYAWTVEAEINLVGAYDFCSQLTNMLAWHLYAKPNGQVRFLDRKPYVMGGDSPEKTVAHPSILSVTEGTSSDELRNRVVVYGANGIYAEASASSPYLPAGFYQTTVLSTYLIDRVDVAQSAADYNLARWNRLTESLNVSIEGDPDLLARDVITFTDTQFLGVNDDYYIYSSEHKLDDSGYILNMELRK
jgi:hypothetical protein